MRIFRHSEFMSGSARECDKIQFIYSLQEQQWSFQLRSLRASNDDPKEKKFEKLTPNLPLLPEKSGFRCTQLYLSSI